METREQAKSKEAEAQAKAQALNETEDAKRRSQLFRQR